MQTNDTKQNLTLQINEFLTYTADIDTDTIVAQYTLIEGLVHQIAANHESELDTDTLGLEEEHNADYDYFLRVNTINPQPIERKAHALEGLQERLRRLRKQLTR